MCCHFEEKDKSVIALLFILGLSPTGIGGLLKRAGHSPLEFSTISSVGHLTTSPLGFLHHKKCWAFSSRILYHK